MVVGSLMCASEKENMVVESPLSSVKIRSGRFSTCNRARLLSVEDGQARVEVHTRRRTSRRGRDWTVVQTLEQRRQVHYTLCVAFHLRRVTVVGERETKLP